MSKYKQLGKNTALVFIGNIGSKLIAFLMLPFYTKMLSVEDFGTSDNALIYVSLLIGIVTLSISESIFIFPKDQEIKIQKKIFTSGLVYSGLLLVLTGFILLGAKDILMKGNLLKSVTDNIVYIYLLIISLFLQTFLQQFARGINRINVYAISGVILTLLTAILSIILIPKYSLGGFFISQILSFLITAVYTLVHSKSYKYFALKELNFEKYGEMAKYSIPLIPNAIMWWLVGSMNRPIMEEYLGMHAIGLFAIAYKLPSLINILFSVIMVSWQISVIEEYKKEDYTKFYNKIFRLVFILLTFCLIMISILSKPLIGIIADPKFMDASKYIPILSLSALFSSISSFVGANFSATRESKYYFYSSIWGAVTAVVLNLSFIPVWGLYGAVFAMVISHFVMALSRIKYSWKTVMITNVYFYILLLVVCLIIILTLCFVNNFKLLISIIFIGCSLFSLLIKKDLIKVVQIVRSGLLKRN
jgi:O-antigen/teichoic acid export membrane protein